MWTEAAILTGFFIFGYVAGKIRLVDDQLDSDLSQSESDSSENYQDAEIFEMPSNTEVGQVYGLASESFEASTQGLWSLSSDGCKVLANDESGAEKVVFVLSKAKAAKPSEGDVNFILDAHNEIVPTFLDFVVGVSMRDAQTNKEVTTILETEEAKTYSPQLKMLLENIKKTTNIYSDMLNGESIADDNKNS